MATAAEYAAWIVANQDKKGTPEFDTVASAYQLSKQGKTVGRAPDALDNTNMATEGMSGVQKFAAGAGKAIADTGLGLKQLASYVVPGMDTAQITADVIEGRKRDRPLMDTGAGMAGNIAGNVGMALGPGAALKGAGTVAAALPASARVAQALSAAGGVAMAPTSIPAALGVGAAQGMIQPAADGGERLSNTLIGAGATAAVPVATRAFKAGKAALEPFYEGGKDQIIGRALRNASGGKADEVTQALMNAPEYVPGSIPTAGQASKNAGIAAMERAAVAVSPEATVAHSERQAAQNAARVGVLEDMAGSTGQREFFDASRRTAADKLYKEAYDAGVDLSRDAATGQFLSKAEQAARKGEITKLMQTPAMKEASKRARTLMLNDPNMRGKALSPDGSVQGLDYARRALSDMIGEAKGSNEKRILTALKSRLDTTLETISPKYAEAVETFAEMSRPINQMDIAQTIADKSVDRLTGTLKPQNFARALDDSTAASATGFKGATLDKVMTPEQLAKLDAIKQDVARAVMARDAGRGAGSDTVQKLAYTNLIDQAGVPTFVRNFSLAQIPANLAGRAADAAYGRANKEIAEKLALGLLDPKEAARMMQSATPSRRAEIAALIASRTLTPLGMSAPALNAAQQ